MKPFPFFLLRNIWICSEGLNLYWSEIVGFANKPFNYRGDIYFEVINIINIKKNAEYLLSDPVRYVYLSSLHAWTFRSSLKYLYRIPITSYVIFGTSVPPLATLLTHFPPQ